LKLEILISTNNEKIHNIQKILLSPMKNISYLISHQVYDGKEYDFKSERKDVRYIKSYVKGLSKNRNVSLLNAKGEICLISDDDVSYSKEFFDNIIKAFKENPDADIITFKIKTNPSEPEYKNYPKSPIWHDFRTIFKVSSGEIAFRLKEVKKINIKFDEMFGLGSLFKMGEENIFLFDALYKGLKIRFVPLYIVNSLINIYGLTDKYKKNYIISLGALFFRIFGFSSILFDIFSSYYNFHEYRKKQSFFRYLTLTFRGSFLAYKILKVKKRNSHFILIKLFYHFISKKFSDK